jgi:fructuronate reductase
LKIRLPNPFLPDTPQRIVTDTSQKLSVRFGETVKTYTERGDLDIDNLKLIPLVFAAWLRYLMGTDDSGASMELSPDPLYLSLKSHIKHVKLGVGAEDPVRPLSEKTLDGTTESSSPTDYRSRIKPILEDSAIFGVNLYEAGQTPSVGEKVENLFGELITEAGAVRKTLQKYLEL